MTEKHGFRLLRDEYSDDFESEINLYEHIKSGARLITVKNDDKNRVFLIGFRTPSDTGTGVAHILEHSTLCGSKKYPVKEPFVELAKGSLNTFLNAMTYSDKTVYPVASTNEKELRNLMDVYLDAVFYPNIYNNPYTFMQEGWHYHLENEEEPIRYNGVVYNEMKGVYSDPDSILEHESFKALFPDTIYGEDSGGEPDKIPNLTSEDFLDFHSRLYHPSNSYIYLYGDNDLDEQLEYLNSWLEPFDKKEIDSAIKLQEPFKERVEIESTYPINPGQEKEKDKDIMALNIAFSPDLTGTERKALSIIFDVLLDNNASVLKKALLEKGIAGEVNAYFDTPMLQPVLMILLKDTNKEKKEEFLETVNSVLEDIVENGFNQEDLQASINSSEFRVLEAIIGEGSSLPKGLPLGLNLFKTWLYDKDPFDRFKITEQFGTLKQYKENGTFEKLLKENLLENPHQSLVILTPDETMTARHEEELMKKLEDYKNSLTEDELKALVEMTKNLIKAQSAVDTPEDLEKIPHIKVSEIEKKATPVNYEMLECDGVPVIYVESKSKEIIYLRLNFSVDDISSEDLPYLVILDNLISSVSTENMDYQSLNREIDMYTGGIDSKISIYSNQETGKVHSLFSYKIAMRKEYLKKALELLKEVAFNGIYTEKDLIENLLRGVRLHQKAFIQNQGNAIASLRTRAFLSESSRIDEELEGIEFYKFISEIDDNFDEHWPEISEKVSNLAKKILNKTDMTISLACRKDYVDEVFENLTPIIEDLKEEDIKPAERSFKDLTPNEAFITTGNVMYNAKSGRIEDLDDINIGALFVLKTILSMDYLWNRVRVLGGAYGAGFGFNKLGEVFFTTFRDPNLDKTYETFDGVVDYINNLDLNEKDLEKYIIGTISPMDIPRSTKTDLALAQRMYYTKSTNEETQLYRDQVLATTLEDLKKNAEIIDEAFKENYICTIGTDSAINANKELFEEIEYVK